MDRRAFLALILAGAADNGPATRVAPPGLSPAVAAGPAAGDDAGPFDSWLSDFSDRAVAAGLPADVVHRELAGLRPDPAVLALDGRQPEFSKPIGDYVRGVISDDRVATGRRELAELTALPAIETRYGVPAEILISIWAVESAFGAIQGDFDVVRALATLAAQGRRRDWAEQQLTAALRILAGGKASRAQLRGSWAGAMGQTQLEPTSYLTAAVDWNGGDRPDIWGQPADALASAANLLAQAGWREGQAWDREVRLPAGFDYSLTEASRQSTAAWAAMGVKPADGDGWRMSDAADQAVLIVPAGAAGPAFLLLPNHFVIRQYNDSTAYALAVGLLADRISGAGPLAAAWPPETPLSLADRIGAQSALAKLGFDPGQPDGKIGPDTRQALRNWQKARNLVADGYLSPDVLARLQAEAAAASIPPAPPAPPL